MKKGKLPLLIPVLGAVVDPRAMCYLWSHDMKQYIIWKPFLMALRNINVMSVWLCLNNNANKCNAGYHQLTLAKFVYF